MLQGVTDAKAFFFGLFPAVALACHDKFPDFFLNYIIQGIYIHIKVLYHSILIHIINSHRVLLRYSPTATLTRTQLTSHLQSDTGYQIHHEWADVQQLHAARAVSVRRHVHVSPWAR
jgi:hypothetical protein